MIIQSILSENFLKYDDLQLRNLPKSGVITVGGQNESGKTSIGETLCFALFGRTFTLDQSEPKKLIRWGASQCSVSVEFTVEKDDHLYRVDRYLDVDGTYGAKLSRTEDGALLGKGIEAVDSQLNQLIGFAYAEFIESFYLAQRELTTPQPHSETIKVMAGIAPLAKVSKHLDTLVIKDSKALEINQADLSEAKQQLSALAIDQSWMPELSASQEKLQSILEHKQTLREKISSSAQAYSNAIGQLKKKWLEFKVIRFISLVLGLSTLLFGSCWLALTRTAQSSTLHSLFANNISADPVQTFKIFLVFGVLTLVGLAFLLAQRMRIKPLRQQAGEFSTTLEDVINDEDVPSYADRVQQLIQVENDQQEPSTEDAMTSSALNELLYRCKKYAASDEDVRAASNALGTQYRKQIDHLGKHKLQHDFAIRDEQARLDMHAELISVEKKLIENTAEQTHNITVHTKGNELLESASQFLSHRFNQSILELASKALPKFTRDRYKHLKIDEQLDVRVFSNKKGDFLDFDEISSGTQRQVMLSLRLAMSQQLIAAIECGKQFLFLDEPFAFFDQQRIRDTIAALPEFSQDIQQIWLVAQEFPTGTRTKLAIECSQDQDKLIIPPL